MSHVMSFLFKLRKLLRLPLLIYNMNTNKCNSHKQNLCSPLSFLQVKNTHPVTKVLTPAVLHVSVF